jgi:hypothetical protein
VPSALRATTKTKLESEGIGVWNCLCGWLLLDGEAGNVRGPGLEEMYKNDLRIKRGPMTERQRAGRARSNNHMKKFGRRRDCVELTKGWPTLGGSPVLQDR